MGTFTRQHTKRLRRSKYDADERKGSPLGKTDLLCWAKIYFYLLQITGRKGGGQGIICLISENPYLSSFHKNLSFLSYEKSKPFYILNDLGSYPQAKLCVFFHINFKSIYFSMLFSIRLFIFIQDTQDKIYIKLTLSRLETCPTRKIFDRTVTTCSKASYQAFTPFTRGSQFCRTNQVLAGIFASFIIIYSI